VDSVAAAVRVIAWILLSDDLVSAILRGAVAREKQHKFIGNFEPIEVEAHAAL
jgi:hypothetical protein